MLIEDRVRTECHFCRTAMLAETHVERTGAWVCPRCNFVECHPRPRQEDLDLLYGDIAYHRLNTDPDGLLAEVKAQ